MQPSGCVCCYCKRSAQGNFAIHRDGLGDGPELPLCDACGSSPDPSCETIWAKLASDAETMAESIHDAT